MRVIAYPVQGCTFSRPAVDAENEHFPTCPLMRIHCRKFRLPVRVSTLATQECLKELKAALTNMVFTRPNSVSSSNLLPMHTCE